jgi:hypothetical protein
LNAGHVKSGKVALIELLGFEISRAFDSAEWEDSSKQERDCDYSAYNN